MLLRPAFLLLVLFAALICGTPARAECAGRTLEGETIYRAPVCVPQTPGRIVALDSTYNLTMALELGLPVVGAPLFDVQDKELLAMAKAAGLEDIGGATEPSIERIIALQPDLILGDAFMHAPAYDLASQIAPTLLVQAQNWKTFYMTLASATGADDKAKQPSMAMRSGPPTSGQACRTSTSPCCGSRPSGSRSMSTVPRPTRRSRCWATPA
jgi:iron complex transport system substrate-binding protein